MICSSRVLAVAAVAMTLNPGESVAKGFPFKLDPEFCTVTFSVKHREISYVVGQFTSVSGEIVADSAFKPKAFEFDVSVEAKSIFTNSKKRDTHLKSKDFLDARKKPLIEFKSSESKRLTAEEFELTGTLVFNGVSKTLVVKTEVGGPKKVGKLLYRLGVHTTFTVLRSEFEFGPNLDDIGDEVTVTVDLQAEYELPPIG